MQARRKSVIRRKRAEAGNNPLGEEESKQEESRSYGEKERKRGIIRKAERKASRKKAGHTEEKSGSGK